MSTNGLPLSALQSWLFRREEKATPRASQSDGSFEEVYRQHYPAIFAFLQVLVGTPKQPKTWHRWF